MVITVLIVVRVIYKIEHIVTMLHMERMAKVLMATGLMVVMPMEWNFHCLVFWC